MQPQKVAYNTEEFEFTILHIFKAFPNSLNEKIIFCSAYGTNSHINWFYVLTDKNLYIYDASNGISFKESLIFKIPCCLIDYVGYEIYGFLNMFVVYVKTKNKMIIPLKVYINEDEVSNTVKKINKIVSEYTFYTSEETSEAAGMILVKGIIKRSEYNEDYLSPYKFERSDDKIKIHINKNKRTISKIKGKQENLIWDENIDLINIPIQQVIDKYKKRKR